MISLLSIPVTQDKSKMKNMTLLQDTDKLKALLNFDNPTILEVGCNDGTDSWKFLELFPNAQLYCFEPEPRAITQFKERINDEHCHLYEVALGAENGKSIFHQSSGTTKGSWKADWDLSGSLNKPTGHHEFSPWVKFETQIEVPVRTLDSIVSEIGLNTIDLIWMDVQGGEQNVIRGGRETLKHTKFIYAEFSHWNKPLYEGQMTKDETMQELGSDWEFLDIYDTCNILARNKTKE